MYWNTCHLDRDRMGAPVRALHDETFIVDRYGREVDPEDSTCQASCICKTCEKHYKCGCECGREPNPVQTCCEYEKEE